MLAHTHTHTMWIQEIDYHFHTEMKISLNQKFTNQKPKTIYQPFWNQKIVKKLKTNQLNDALWQRQIRLLFLLRRTWVHMHGYVHGYIFQGCFKYLSYICIATHTHTNGATFPAICFAPPTTQIHAHTLNPPHQSIHTHFTYKYMHTGHWEINNCCYKCCPSCHWFSQCIQISICFTSINWIGLWPIYLCPISFILVVLLHISQFILL